VNFFVVDVSVAAKWVLPRKDEPLAAEASELLARHINGEIRLFVPDLFWPELGNVLWKAIGRGRIAASEAHGAINVVRDHSLGSLVSSDLLADALELAVAFNRTVYDSLYVVAAVASGSTLVTADERLVNALGGRFPVRWLGVM
jgi:predicted nucleic acid-binding protein